MELISAQASKFECQQHEKLSSMCCQKRNFERFQVGLINTMLMQQIQTITKSVIHSHSFEAVAGFGAFKTSEEKSMT